MQSQGSGEFLLIWASRCIFLEKTRKVENESQRRRSTCELVSECSRCVRGISQGHNDSSGALLISFL